MAQPKGQPGLAILIGHALAKKGKAMHDPMPMGDEPEDAEGYSSPEEADAHLQEIADDMLKAIEAKDSQALKELLKEAFECLESAPHEEGPHIGESEEGNSNSSY